MNDIFLSYRRKDAESTAFLLFKDLTQLGYSVFYDHKCIGEGDYMLALEQSVQQATDIIVILSESSFSERIFAKDDVYRKEIEFAFQFNKRIIGIMLEDFPGFPDNLPQSIERIRYVNCVKLYIPYYDAMLERLTSGSFLHTDASNKINMSPSNVAIQSGIPSELLHLSQLPPSQRIQATQLLLQIMESFNSSTECMRFYQYIDIFDRNKGIKDIPEYSGEIPTDLTTYLSFFETLYIIVASGTLDISVIDFAYRFRFFAGCNTPLMQESELLPLGYQYPNILAFYNLWIDHIVSSHNHCTKCESLPDIIPLYEHDLHKKYAAYMFAQKPSQPMLIRFLNRNLVWLNLSLRLMNSNDLQDSLTLQNNMLNGIDDNNSTNLFEPLSIPEMEWSLRHDVCVGLFTRQNELVAQFNLILSPTAKTDITLDLSTDLPINNAAILDYVVVDPNFRGYSIQKTMLYVAECISKNNLKSGVCAVTSPLNTYSIKNFLSQEFKIIATLPKYKSTRHYMWKAISAPNA